MTGHTLQPQSPKTFHKSINKGNAFKQHNWISTGEYFFRTSVLEILYFYLLQRGKWHITCLEALPSSIAKDRSDSICTGIILIPVQIPPSNSRVHPQSLSYESFGVLAKESRSAFSHLTCSFPVPDRHEFPTEFAVVTVHSKKYSTVNSTSNVWVSETIAPLQCWSDWCIRFEGQSTQTTKTRQGWIEVKKKEIPLLCNVDNIHRDILFLCHTETT